MLFENLHGAVGKSQAVKVLQELADRQLITSKEFGKQKLFWRRQACSMLSPIAHLYSTRIVLLFSFRSLHDVQDEVVGFDAETLAKMDEQIQQFEHEVVGLNEQCKSFSNGTNCLLLHNLELFWWNQNAALLPLCCTSNRIEAFTIGSD